jgi:hypothetical protein
MGRGADDKIGVAVEELSDLPRGLHGKHLNQRVA